MNPELTALAATLGVTAAAFPLALAGFLIGAVRLVQSLGEIFDDRNS